jgi:hypothetical protein
MGPLTPALPPTVALLNLRSFTSLESFWRDIARTNYLDKEGVRSPIQEP